MRSIKDRYETDNSYRRCVDSMEYMIHEKQFTPSEMREMAVLASIHYEMAAARPLTVPITKAAEDALQVLQQVRMSQ